MANSQECTASLGPESLGIVYLFWEVHGVGLFVFVSRRDDGDGMG